MEVRMTIRKVGVLGCGIMGSGIAQVTASAGFETTVLEASGELLEKGMRSIERFLDQGVEKGRLDEAGKARILANLRGSTDLEELRASDLIIEAVAERLEVKREVLRALDGRCSTGAIFASNTSSLSITELACATTRPARFVGLHFFNPAPLMKPVEVVRTILTDERVYEEAVAFVERIGKVPIRTSDRTGFIVNRLLVPYILDAVRALEEGVGSIRDIDEAMRLGCGHPMGPLALLDLVGLDTTVSIAGVFFEEFREPRFACPPLLKRMVLAGYHGRKTGKGFYDYGGDAPVPNDFLVGGA
jgi:3-hydroxybutyryl-CoA dehydrogenase